MKIIYVDDEQPALDNFRLTTQNFTEIASLHMFLDGKEALAYAGENTVDVAFLDMEMPGIHGLELAKALKKIDEHTRIVFVTAFGQYALEAWKVDAVGYLMKPYSAADIHKALSKCAYRALPSQKVEIRTIPTLSVTVNGASLHISAAKPRELLALLVDRGDSGVTTGEAIACLWPERQSDAGTQSLMRMTYKRLAAALEEAGAGEILYTKENRRYLKTDLVSCDLYRILGGDRQALRTYGGEYLREYDWAEQRNGQLHRMISENF